MHDRAQFIGGENLRHHVGGQEAEAEAGTEIYGCTSSRSQLSEVVCTERGDSPAMSKRRYVLWMCLPLCEMVCGQIQGVWQPRVGPLSFSQAYHCVVLAISFIYLIQSVRSRAQRPLVVEALIASFMLITGFSTVLCLSKSTQPSEDIVAFFQLVYWMIIWLMLHVECSSMRGCRVVLRGIYIGGTYMAVSVIGFWLFLGERMSKYEQLADSAGGLTTAKSLGGILCVSIILTLCIRQPLAKLILLSINITGLMLTYQRAGQVALGIAILWLIKSSFRPQIAAGLLSGRTTVLLLIGVIVAVSFVDMEGLASRWSDLRDGDKAGSGRVGLWRDAASVFGKMSPLEKVLGIGYSGMRDAMSGETWASNRKHTHNNLLDMLLAFGLLGASLWLCVHCVLLYLISRCSKASVTYVLAMAVYLVFAVESLFTGQAFGAHAMIIYIGTIVALLGISLSQADSGILNSFGDMCLAGYESSHEVFTSPGCEYISAVDYADGKPDSTY